MEAGYLICLFSGSFLSAIIAYLIFNHSLGIILNGLVDGSIATALANLINWSLFTISILAGVGFPSRVYGGVNGGYSWPTVPSDPIEYFLVVYKASAAAMTGIFCMIVVILFTCLVLHVGLVRAKFIASKS